jgi:hypothetical protein
MYVVGFAKFVFREARFFTIKECNKGTRNLDAGGCTKKLKMKKLICNQFDNNYLHSSTVGREN